MGKLKLTGKERRRLELFTGVKRGKMSLHKAAELLKLGVTAVPQAIMP